MNYQGYSARTLKGLDLDKYIKKGSAAALKRYFQGRTEWGKVVVDFGGRIGENTRLINNVTVVEIDKSAQKIMRDLNIQYKSGLEEFADTSIDTIFACHTLEHVTEPYRCLNSFRKKLKHSGTLIIVLPLEGILSSGIDENGHLYSWNMRTLTTLLNASGFEVKHARLRIIGTDYLFKLDTFIDKLLLFVQRISLMLILPFILKRFIEATHEMVIYATKK